MKRFLTLVAGTMSALSLLVLPVSAATTRYWKVDIYQPSATTNKTLKVEYKVLSTIKEDNNYTIELFENAFSKGTQNIVHEYGDSGVFNIAIPAAGTYTYKVVVTNTNAGETKPSNTQTVQVSDAPEPVVTTVVVNQPAAGGAGAGAADGGAGGGAGAQAGAGQPAVAGAETTAPQTSATTTNQGVLGAEAAKERAKQASNRNKYLVPSALFIVLAIAGYTLYKRHLLANE